MCSDLHLEFGTCSIQNAEGASVLILAGDVCVAEDMKRYPADHALPPGGNISPRYVSAALYRDFFLDASRAFEHVIYVMGNHEHYEGALDRTHAILQQELAAIAPNIHLLENAAVDVAGVRFLGMTLWTDMDKGDALAMYRAEGAMSDYRQIRIAGDGYRRLRARDTVAQHRQSLQFLKAQVAAAALEEVPVVVVSHQSPCHLSVADCYRGDSLNCAYVSDLSSFILDSPTIKLWCHGHLHNRSDYLLGATRVVCQPRGYYGVEHSERELSLKYIEL